MTLRSLPRILAGGAWRLTLRAPPAKHLVACFLLGHAPKEYCETVRHYEVRCRRCAHVMVRIPALGSDGGE